MRITTGFDRPNLYFGVQMPHSKALALLKLIEERPGKCGIVYCSTRRTVEEVDALLNDKGIPSTRYHAGLPEEEQMCIRDSISFISWRCWSCVTICSASPLTRCV